MTAPKFGCVPDEVVSGSISGGLKAFGTSARFTTIERWPMSNPIAKPS
jgi:hypothetical protein